MTETRLWFFSVHAQSRGASRLNLLIDEKARMEISQQLDKGATLVTKSHGRHVFEISIFGARTIAVCDVEKRTVVTLIEAKRWYHRIKNGKSRNIRVKPGWKDTADRTRRADDEDEA